MLFTWSSTHARISHLKQDRPDPLTLTETGSFSTMEVLKTFKGRCGADGLTLSTGATMLSSADIQALEDAGYHCIIGSRSAQTPYEIAEYASKPDITLADD